MSFALDNHQQARSLAFHLPSQTVALLDKFPELLITHKISDLESRIEDLRSGLVQFAIVSHTAVAKEMDSKVLKPEKYVLVATKKWKGRSLKEIIKSQRIIDFDDTDQTSFNYLRKFSLADLALPDRHFVNNNSLLRFLIAGLGYGVLIQEVAQPWLESGDLTMLNGGLTLENPLALAWYPRPEVPGYFKAIIQFIK